jgi:lysophospholipase L1-like esterase
MKLLKSILFAVLLSGSLHLSAQTLPYDSTYRPKIYPEKVAAFTADPVKKNDIVFLGNSITAGSDWKTLLSLPNAKNRGISGDITFGVLQRLDEVIQGKPSKVFVLIGINDISRNIPDDVILRNYKSIISRIQKGSKKTQIYFYTLLPVNASFEKFKNHYGKDEHILSLNEEIRKFASEKNVTVIDLYSHFIDGEKHLKAELTKDGLHLIPAGYEVWAHVLNKGGYLK